MHALGLQELICVALWRCRFLPALTLRSLVIILVFMAFMRTNPIAAHRRQYRLARRSDRFFSLQRAKQRGKNQRKKMKVADDVVLLLVLLVVTMMTTEGK